MKDMRILIIGSYKADHLESMIRFSELLPRFYFQHFSATLVHIPSLFTRLPFLPAFVKKYFAYVDKLIIFPIYLLTRAHSFDFVHISDHGYSFYSFCFPRQKSLVTCHDLLAMRAAFGDASTACSTSLIGIWFQYLIKFGLQRAGAVVCDSHATFLDYQRLIGRPLRQRQAVIPIPLNASFKPDVNAFHLTQAEENQIPEGRFLLMVGSSHPRKNRFLALQLLDFYGTDCPYQVVFAGSPLTSSEQLYRNSHPFGSRLTSIRFPSHALLNRLYCEAHALLFPSYSEGFGWPVVEAQTCCCPVIASTTTSIPEVAGDGALYADPTDVATFAAHVRSLDNPAERTRLIELGQLNSHRFELEVIADAYRQVFFELPILAAPTSRTSRP